jgi:hypothetical protein
MATYPTFQLVPLSPNKKIVDEKEMGFLSFYHFFINFKVKNPIYIKNNISDEVIRFWNSKVLIILITKPLERFQ